MRNLGNYIYDFAHSFFGEDFYSNALCIACTERRTHSIEIYDVFYIYKYTRETPAFGAHLTPPSAAVKEKN